MPDDFNRSSFVPGEPSQSDMLATLLNELRSIVREELEAAAETTKRAPALLTAGEVAKLLRVDTRTLRRMVVEGSVPPPLHVGRRAIRWHAGRLYESLGIEMG